jgi:hypothetical protein
MNLVFGNKLTDRVAYSANDLMRITCCEVAMRKNRGFISAFVLVTLAAVNCAKSSDKKEANLAPAVGPELRWQYETGG